MTNDDKILKELKKTNDKLDSILKILNKDEFDIAWEAYEELRKMNDNLHEAEYKMKKKLLIIALITALILTISITAAAETVKNGDWIVKAWEDPLTDEFTLAIGTQENYNEIGTQEDSNNPLGLRRIEGQTELILITDYLGSVGYWKHLLYRFDQGELVETEWTTSADGSLLFFKKDQDTLKSFVKKMMEHDELIFGYWPYEQSRKTIVYSLNGFATSITPYLDELGWADLK